MAQVCVWTGDMSAIKIQEGSMRMEQHEREQKPLTEESMRTMAEQKPVTEVKHACSLRWRACMRVKFGMILQSEVGARCTPVAPCKATSNGAALELSIEDLIDLAPILAATCMQTHAGLSFAWDASKCIVHHCWQAVN